MASPGRTTQVAILPVIGTVLGNVNFSLVELLKSIPLIGNLFKGSTQHVDYDTAVAKSNEVAANFMKVWDALDAGGRDVLYNAAKNYFMSDVLARFGSWWDNAISTDFAGWQAKGWLSDPRTATYHYLGQPVFYFLRFEDSTRVEETFAERYTTRVDSKVWQPIRTYVQDHYNTSLENFTLKAGGGGGGDTVTVAGFNFNWKIALVIAAVLMVAYFAFFHKK